MNLYNIISSVSGSCKAPTRKCIVDLPSIIYSTYFLMYPMSIIHVLLSIILRKSTVSCKRYRSELIVSIIFLAVHSDDTVV